MENFRKYQIEFQGLSEGLHEFKFDIDNVFFENLEYSDIKKGELIANVLLNKRARFLELKIDIEGSVQLICDRCLDEYNQKINYSGTLYVKFSENIEEDIEDVIYLSPNDHELNIAHYLYESINLSIPLKRVHPEDKEGNMSCNTEMLKKLDKYKKDHITDSSVDPRWNELEKLMRNNN